MGFRYLSDLHTGHWSSIDYARMLDQDCDSRMCIGRRTKYSDVLPEGSFTPPPKIVFEVETTWPWLGRWALVAAPPFRTVVPRSQPFVLERDMIIDPLGGGTGDRRSVSSAAVSPRFLSSVPPSERCTGRTTLSLWWRFTSSWDDLPTQSYS